MSLCSILKTWRQLWVKIVVASSSLNYEKHFNILNKYQFSNDCLEELLYIDTNIQHMSQSVRGS